MPTESLEFKKRKSSILMVFDPKDLIQRGATDKDLGFGDEEELAPIGDDSILHDAPFEIPNDILDIKHSKSQEEVIDTVATSPTLQLEDPFNKNILGRQRAMTLEDVDSPDDFQRGRNNIETPGFSHDRKFSFADANGSGSK